MKKKFRVVKNFKIVKRSCSLNRYYRVVCEHPLNIWYNFNLDKVCIIRLDHICFEKYSSTFSQVCYCVHRTRRSCQKYDEDLRKGKTRPHTPSHALTRPHTPSALLGPKPHALSQLWDPLGSYQLYTPFRSPTFTNKAEGVFYPRGKTRPQVINPPRH